MVATNRVESNQSSYGIRVMQVTGEDVVTETMQPRVIDKEFTGVADPDTNGSRAVTLHALLEATPMQRELYLSLKSDEVKADIDPTGRQLLEDLKSASMLRRKTAEDAAKGVVRTLESFPGTG